MVAGIHVYGGIKAVRGTKVATTFFMVMGLPLIPGYSLYYVGQGEAQGAILPVAGGFVQQELLGVACNRIDRLSVLIGYLRAYGTALIVAGAFGLLALFSISLGPNSGDPFESALPVVLGVLLAVGLLAVGATYVVGSRIAAEELCIRSICADVLGIAADPANVDPKTAAAWRDEVREQLAAMGADMSLCKLDDCPHLPADVARLQLLLARAELAVDPNQLEPLTISRAIVQRLTACA
jgi:hypothetical protein